MLAKLTDVDLSRLIAESIELMPQTRPILGNQLSPAKCWRTTCVDPKDHEGGFLADLAKGWQPRDMVSDPAMTVLLLERMRREFDLEISVIRIRFTSADVALTLRARLATRRDIAIHSSIGRAVAETYAVAFDLRKE